MTRDGGATDPARRPIPPGPFAHHYIVCGGNALAHRLIFELVEHYEVPVVAVVPDLTRDHAMRIERMPGVSAVIEAPAVTDETLRDAGVAQALGLALVDGDDQTNIHAALAAQGHNTELRIVLRLFNQRLADHVQKLLKNCTALSGSATAAPAFANAALSRPNSVQVGDRYLYIAFDADIDSHQVCVVADRIDHQDLSRIRLLPEAQSRARTFIDLATRMGPEAPVELPAPRTERSPSEQGERGGMAALQLLGSEPPLSISWFTRLRWRVVDAFHFFTGARLMQVLFAAFAAIAGGAAVIWYFNKSFWWTVYLTLLDMAGAAQPDSPTDPTGGTGGPWQRTAQVVITFFAITFVPVATAILVESLATGRRNLPKKPSSGLRDHVIVVGLGNAGTRVAGLLREYGVPVVGIERDPSARGVIAAGALGIPVLVDDGPQANQLLRAQVKRARAVVAVTSDDAVNLEAALEARAVNPDIRLALRLFDDEFARHVYATLGNVASRSVSYLAAPAFAAALMGREVLGTLSVLRNVLLIAELTADEDSSLIGRNQHDIEDLGGVRVIAVRLAVRPDDYLWNYADRARGLLVGDSIVVAATRIGLARLNSTTATR